MKNTALRLESPPRERRPLPRQASRLRSTRPARRQTDGPTSGRLPDALKTALDSLAFLFLLGSAMGTFWAVSLL